jgi:hypothetical protein
MIVTVLVLVLDLIHPTVIQRVVLLFSEVPTLLLRWRR